MSRTPPDEAERAINQHACEEDIVTPLLHEARRMPRSVPSMQQLSGSAILDSVELFVRRFCAFRDEHSLVAVTLWAAMTHMTEHFHATPRLALLSPEPGSGKTRALEVLALLVRDSLHCLNASSASIFRILADRPVTLLADECDAIFARQGGKEDRNVDLKALLNAGYKKGATIPRCIGPRHEVQEFDVYCPVALAGLGDLPETLMSRSVVIRMRRRAPDEHIEPFRTRAQETPGHALREQLSAWAELVGGHAGNAWPELPAGIADRPAEIWEPLIAIADVAGASWPQRAREACVAFCYAPPVHRQSLGIRLLHDLRTIFGNADSLATDVILARLHHGQAHGLEDDAPWSDLRGKPLDARRLAQYLKPYGVSPKVLRLGAGTARGYTRTDLHDVWSRYLTPPAPTECVTSVTSNASGPEAAEDVTQVTHSAGVGGADVAHVAATDGGQVLCQNCRHFKPDTDEDARGMGACLEHGCGTWPAVLIDCREFTPREGGAPDA